MISAASQRTTFIIARALIIWVVIYRLRIVLYYYMIFKYVNWELCILAFYKLLTKVYFWWSLTQLEMRSCTSGPHTFSRITNWCNAVPKISKTIFKINVKNEPALYGMYVYLSWIMTGCATRPIWNIIQPWLPMYLPVSFE